MSKPNWFKANKGSELNADFDLNWYETQFRSYDPLLGRFVQIDAMADYLSGTNPYNFAFNNPIFFNDPTGLVGEGCPEGQEDCDDNEYEGGTVAGVTVYGSRSSGSGLSAGQLNWLTMMQGSSNPIFRGIRAEYDRNGVDGLRNLFSHSRTLSFSADGYEDAIAHGKAYAGNISKLATYGIGGTMLAAVASPMAIEIMTEAGLMTAPSFSSFSAKGYLARVGVDLGMQVTTNSITAGKLTLNNIDAFDLGVSGFGLNIFWDAALKSGVDLTTDGISVVGFGKNRDHSAIEFGMGTFTDGLANGMLEYPSGSLTPLPNQSTRTMIPVTLFKLSMTLATNVFKDQNDKN